MVELLNDISSQIERSQLNWPTIASQIGIDENDIVQIQKDTNQTFEFVNAITRKIWKNIFHYVGLEFINTVENVFEVSTLFSLGNILVECDTPSKAQEKCEFKVVEEISQRVSEWKMFGRILGLNESFISLLERDHQSCSKRNNEIMRKFCSPLEPNQSWLLWRHYLIQFEDGVNVIKEMETTYIDLLAQTPDTSDHIMKTEKRIYIGHSYGNIKSKAIHINKSEIKSEISVCVGSKKFNWVDRQEFSEWLITQKRYMDIYKMLKDQKSINFVEGSEKLCPILETLKQYLDMTNDPGFAVKGYNYVNHYSLFREGMFAKDHFRNTYCCYLANDNIVLYITESAKGTSHALYDSIRNIQIANTLHEDFLLNNIIQINVILHEQKDEIHDTSFCKQCIDNKLYTSKETFTDNLRFTTWYNDLLSIHKIQNKTKEHLPTSQSVIDICETLKRDMITYEALETNIYPSFSYCYEDQMEELKKLILLSPTQFQVLHSNEKHILLRGSYGSGKSVVLLKKLEQIINSGKPSDITYLICNDQQSKLHSYMKFIQSKFPKQNILVCNSHHIIPQKAIPNLSVILKHLINVWDNKVTVNVLIDEFNGSYFDQTEVKEVCKMIELFKNSFIVIALQSMEEKVSEVGKNIELTDLILGYQYDILTKDTSFVCYNLDYSLRCSYEINKFIETTAHILESYKVSYDYKCHVHLVRNLVIDKEQAREHYETQAIGPAKVNYIFNQKESGHNVSCGPVNIYFVRQSWFNGHEKSCVLFLSVLKYILKEISDEKKYVISTFDEDLYNSTHYFLEKNSYIFTNKINEFVKDESKFQILLTDYASIRGYEFPNFIFLVPFGKRYLKFRIIECFYRTTTELHIIADNTRQRADKIEKQLIKKWKEMDCVKFFVCEFNRLSNTFNMFTGKLHILSEKNPLEKLPKHYSNGLHGYRWSWPIVRESVRNDNYDDDDDKTKALYYIMNSDNAILMHEFCSIHGSDILTYCDNNKKDWLCIAASLNAANILHLLIQEHGFDVNSSNLQGDTPLHIAAQNGNIDIANTLLISGALIHAEYLFSCTPLHDASRCGHTNIIQLLLKEGCQVNVKSMRNRTPLHLASKCGHLEAVKLLIENGADINAKDSFGQMPLHFASECGRLETVKLLIENGADVNAKDSDGNDCINLATRHRCHDVVRFIKSLK